VPTVGLSKHHNDLNEKNLVGVTTISCANQKWRKLRKMKIAFIYPLAAMCTRTCKSID
jgi:hypothetical protein